VTNLYRCRDVKIQLGMSLEATTLPFESELESVYKQRKVRKELFQSKPIHCVLRLAEGA